MVKPVGSVKSGPTDENDTDGREAVRRSAASNPAGAVACSRYGVTMLKLGSGRSSTAMIDGSASASPVT